MRRRLVGNGEMGRRVGDTAHLSFQISHALALAYFVTDTVVTPTPLVNTMVIIIDTLSGVFSSDLNFVAYLAEALCLMLYYSHQAESNVVDTMIDLT